MQGSLFDTPKPAAEPDEIVSQEDTMLDKWRRGEVAGFHLEWAIFRDDEGQDVVLVLYLVELPGKGVRYSVPAMGWEMGQAEDVKVAMKKLHAQTTKAAEEAAGRSFPNGSSAFTIAWRGETRAVMTARNDGEGHDG